MILVIDDLRTFKFDALYARNSDDGLTLLQYCWGEVDELWLDHDLGGIDTIMPCVNYLLERAVWDNPYPVDTIYVHTSNPSAAHSMVLSLSKYYNVTRVTQTDLDNLILKVND